MAKAAKVPTVQRTHAKPVAPKGLDARRGAGMPAVPPPAQVKRVRATFPGFYNLRMQQPGDVFDLVDPKHFSRRWMEPVDPSTPLTHGYLSVEVERQTLRVRQGLAPNQPVPGMPPGTGQAPLPTAISPEEVEARAQGDGDPGDQEEAGNGPSPSGAEDVLGAGSVSEVSEG